MLRRGTLAFIVLIALLGLAVLLWGQQRSFNRQKPEASQDLPVAEFSGTDSADAKRQAKGHRYDRPKSSPIRELPAGEDVLPLNVDQFDLSALPVAQSDVVLAGQVVGRQAYLSNDRGAVYSEFTILVEDVLKNSQPPLFVSQQITIERWGGSVRFPSGKVQHYIIDKRRMPQLHEKYVFFLKCNEHDYDLITGYRVIDGRIDPLDSGLPFANYEDASVQRFFVDLKTAIQVR